MPQAGRLADDSLSTDTAIDFQVAWGYAALAKFILGLVLLIIAAAVTITWLVGRRVRRCKARQVVMIAGKPSA